MALEFHRRLSVPLWAIAFLAVALTAWSPATLVPMPPMGLFVIAAVGIAAIAGAISWLRPSRSPVRVLPSRHRDHLSPAITMAVGTCARTLTEANGRTTDDALDLVRMDDDLGWQMPRPPAVTVSRPRNRP